MQRKALIYGSSALIFLAIMIVLPSLFQGQQAFFCPQRASAQENDCLEQAATISAMQVALIQGTVDSMNYQATITSLEQTVASLNTAQTNPSNTPLSTVVPGGAVVLFQETFDDISRGWRLYSDDYTAARLSAGQLRLSSQHRRFASIDIPGTPNSNFFVEATMTAAQGGGYVGFRLGNRETNHQYLMIGSDCNAYCYWFVKLWEVDPIADDMDEVFATEYSPGDDLWDAGRPIKIGLDVRNGLTTLYLDNQATEAITPLDTSSVALAFFSTFNSEESVAFDNLSVRETR